MYNGVTILENCIVIFFQGKGKIILWSSSSDGISIAVIKHHGQKYLGEKTVFFIL